MFKHIKQTKNTVARILKYYSIINAVVVFLAAVILAADAEDAGIFIIGTALAICVNFVIYAFGEVIDLLSQIRDNTKANTKTEVDPSIELPDL